MYAWIALGFLVLLFGCSIADTKKDQYGYRKHSIGWPFFWGTCLFFALGGLVYLYSVT